MVMDHMVIHKKFYDPGSSPDVRSIPRFHQVELFKPEGELQIRMVRYVIPKIYHNMKNTPTLIRDLTELLNILKYKCVLANFFS